MHYRNGRQAHNGDRVIKIGYDPNQNDSIIAVGILHSAVAGNDYCNGAIAPIQPTNEGACIVDMLHVDDVMDIIREKGLGKRPEGK